MTATRKTSGVPSTTLHAPNDSDGPVAHLEGSEAVDHYSVGHSEAPLENERYNFTILTFDGLTFWLGLSYFSPTTILPLFVSHLSSSNVVAGAVPAVIALSWALPQLLGARAMSGITSRKRYIIVTALLGRIPLIVMIGIIWAFANSHPQLTLIAFFVCFALFRATSGMNTPVYYDLVGATIHPRQRSRFIGLNQFLGGGIGALALVGGRSLLDSFPFPIGFVLCFGLGTVIITTAIIWMSVVREPPIVKPDGPSQPNVLIQARNVWSTDRTFRRYLIARCLVALTGLASAFFAVQATRELGATDGDVAIYSAILLASQTISTLGWGAIANRLRLMNVMLAGTVLAGSASLLAFMAPSSTIIMLVFALAGASMGAIVVSDGALPLSFAEDSKQDRSLYVAVANTAVSPINLIAPLLGGALADAGGYGTTYVIASLLAVLAAVATVTASTKRPGALSRTLS